MANNTIFFPPLFCRKNERVDIAFKYNNKCANLKKTRIFEQPRSFTEGKRRDRMKNIADVTLNFFSPRTKPELKKVRTPTLCC